MNGLRKLVQTARVYILFLLLILTLWSCQPAQTHNSESKKEEVSHWSYEGETSPEHWADIEKNAECDGLRQSPINIIDIHTITDTSGRLQLSINYSPQTLIHDVLNNGHTIQFDFEPGDSILFHDEVFALKQIHFHEPAEHTINGIRYPIEIHLVHVNKEGEIAVIGVMGEEGFDSNPFAILESFLPIKEGETRILDQAFDLNELIPESQSPFYHYHGSLTTPPCTEGVNWIVMCEPVILSVEQVVLLKEHMPLNNYRNEQPLFDREVFKSF